MSHVPTVLKSDRSVFDKMLLVDDNVTHSILDYKPIEESFISKQINKLSLKKATGHDGISAKILKFAKPVVLQPITFLINETIKVSEFPQ